MKSKIIALLGLLLFCEANRLHGQATPHPNIFVSDVDKLDVQQKISRYTWAKNQYEAYLKELEPYVERHTRDSNWIISRLQMYWQERYTNVQLTSVYGSGEYHWIYSGYAPVPTVRVVSLNVSGKAPSGYGWRNSTLSDLKPYGDGSLRLQDPVTLLWYDVPYSNVGTEPAAINRQILLLATKASIVYWISGNERYAKFASDIVAPLLVGMSYMNDTININPKDYFNTISGWIVYTTIDLTSFYNSLPIIYDFMYPYMVSRGYDVERMQLSLKRIAELLRTRGMNFNNWNAVESYMMALCAMALEGDNEYSDLKGKSYYVNAFLTESTAGHSAMNEYLPNLYDSQTGLWGETAGYHEFPTRHLLAVAVALQKQGFQVFEKYPVLFKSSFALLNVMYPNGTTCGFGDTGHIVPSGQILELGITGAQISGSLYTKYEKQMSSVLSKFVSLGLTERGSTYYQQPGLPLLLYPGELSYGEENSDVYDPSFYAERQGVQLLRNGVDINYGMMAMIQASKTMASHNHDSGISLELYGRGLILGPDASSDPIGYGTARHTNYFARFPAHNTVMVKTSGGQFSYNGVKVMSGVTFSSNLHIYRVEPAPSATRSLSAEFSFMEGYFDDTSTSSDQRRIIGLVRTSARSGYYVDFFRSRVRGGGDSYHDYIYHNIGHNYWMEESTGSKISLSPTSDVNEIDGHMGYSFFTDKVTPSVLRTNDTTFYFQVKNPNGSDIFMKMWMNGRAGRTTYMMTGPEMSYEKPAKKFFGKLDRIPAVVIRQTGDAWRKPFCAIFEPFDGSGTQSSSISYVREVSNRPSDGSFCGVSVTHRAVGPDLAGRIDYILSFTNSRQTYSGESIVFGGYYGAVSLKSNKFRSLYLGEGKIIGWSNYRIESVQGEEVAASLTVSNSKYRCNADHSVVVTLPVERALDPLTNFSMFINRRNKIIEATSVTYSTAGSNEHIAGTITGVIPAGFDNELMILNRELAKYQGIDDEIKFYMERNGRVVSGKNVVVGTLDEISVVIKGPLPIVEDGVNLSLNDILLNDGDYVITKKHFNEMVVRFAKGTLSSGTLSIMVSDLRRSYFQDNFFLKTEDKASLLIWPNPFDPQNDGVLNVRPLFDPKVNTKLWVCDMTGRIVSEIELKGNGPDGVTLWMGIKTDGNVIEDGLYFILPNGVAFSEGAEKLIVKKGALK